MGKITCLAVAILLYISSVAWSGDVKILTPTADSEVIDTVVVIQNEGSATVGFSFGAKVGEEGGYDIQINPDGTYTAVKEQIPVEIQQQIEKYQQLNFNSIDKSSQFLAKGKPQPSGCTTVIVWLQTEDIANLKLCNSYEKLVWSPAKAVVYYSDLWPWDANPSEVGTHWFADLKTDKNYKIVKGSDIWGTYFQAHGYMRHWNYDFDIIDFITEVFHEVYVYGYYPRGYWDYRVNGYVRYDGEHWYALHSHVYYMAGYYCG